MFGFKENKEPWRDGVYLTTVDSTMKADILISKLAAEGIPCMKRHEGASNFLELYMGVSTVFPVELYVPEESLEQALEVIRPVPIEDDFDEITEDELAALAEAGDLEAAEEALRSGEEPPVSVIEIEEEQGTDEEPADGETEPSESETEEEALEEKPEESDTAEEEAPEEESEESEAAEEEAPEEKPEEPETVKEEAPEDTTEESEPSEAVEAVEEAAAEPADPEGKSGEERETEPETKESAEEEPAEVPKSEPETEEPAEEVEEASYAPLNFNAQEPPAQNRSIFLDDEDHECR